MKQPKNSNRSRSRESVPKVFVMLVACISWMLITSQLHAQTSAVKQKVVVLNVDAKNVGYDPAQMGNLVRVELEKLDTFDVMDRYDVSYLVEKKALQIDNCYGKICLVEVGKTLGVEKMLTGSVEQLGNVIIYTMRFIDVPSQSIERTQVTEFLNDQNEL